MWGSGGGGEGWVWGMFGSLAELAHSPDWISQLGMGTTAHNSSVLIDNATLPPHTRRMGGVWTCQSPRVSYSSPVVHRLLETVPDFC